MSPMTDWTICPECSGFGSFEIESPSRPGMYGIASMECFDCGGAGGWPEEEKVGRLPLCGTVAATASPLSRFASSAKLASTIASALADLRGLTIGMAAAFAVLFLMRVTL